MPTLGLGSDMEPLNEEVLLYRQEALKKFLEGSKAVSEELDRRIKDSMKEKEDFYRDFYDGKIEKLDIESKSQDATLVHSLNSFLAEHPRDSKAPYGLLKLAQIYLEEADEAYRREMDDLKGGEEPKKDLSMATRTLEKIKDNFPSFEHMDSVLYLLGYAYLGSSDTYNADRVYERLAREYPESPYAPEAFLRVGENYFSQKNFKKAIAAYLAVLKYPGEALRDKAMYKIAWSNYLLGNYDGAIRDFMGLLEFEPKGGEDPILKDFKKDAQMYIAFSLYRKGKVKSSMAFLGSLSGKPYAYAVNKNLADIYRDRDLFADAATAYRNILSIHPLNRENPSVTTSLIACLRKLSLTRETKLERRSAILAFKQGSRWRAKNAQDEDANIEADLILEDSLYSLAIELDKTGRQEKNAALITEAIDLYTELASYFPKSERAYNAQYYAGEGYSILDRSEKALKAYDEVLKNNYFSRYYDEALYSEIILYERMLDKEGGLQAYKTGEGTAEKDITGLPSKLLSACDHFLEKAPDDGRVPSVMYHSADILEHFMRTESALNRYSFILDRHRDSPFAQDALRKILNIHTRSSEYAKVADIGGNYLKKPYFENPKLRDEVYELVAYARYNLGRDLEKEGKNLEASVYLRNVAKEYPKSKVAENSVLAAFENLKGSNDHKEAKAGLIELLKENPESPLVPRLLFELAKREDDGLDFEAAYAYYGEIGLKYPNSEEAIESLARMAMIHETLEEFSKAADLYLSYARRLPKGELGREAILKAVMNLRGYRFDKILDNETEFISSLRGDELKLAYLYLSISEHYLKKGSRSQCLRYLDRGEASVKKAGSSTIEINDMLFGLRLALMEKRQDEFKSIRLAFPQKRFIAALDKKAAMLEELEGSYLAYARDGSPYISSQALYRLAQIYEDMGRSILEVKIPDSLDPSQSAATKKEIADLGEPLLTKARSALMKNIQDSKERKYFNKWIRSSVEKFSTMIESDTMLSPLELDYRFRFEEPVFIFPAITDAGYPDPAKRPKSALAIKLFEEGVTLIDRTDRKLEALRRASFLFGEAARLSQDFKTARFNKAYIMQIMGNYDVAQFIYRSVEKEPSLKHMVETNLAMIRLSENAIDKAIESLDGILKDRPQETGILSNMAYTLMLKKDERAIKLSRDILEIKPFDELAYNNIAMIYLEKGKPITARRILERSFDRTKSIITVNNLAALDIMEGNMNEAYARLTAVLKEDPGNRTAMSNKVSILLRTQNYEEGLSFARDLWENYGQNEPELYMNLGLAYMSLQKNREAIDHMNANLRFAGPYGNDAKTMITALKKNGGE